MRRPIAPPPSGEVDEFDALARDIGLPGYVTGPRAAIAATAPPRAPFARPLEMRGPQMRRIEQGDFARSRGMGQDDARGDLLYGRTLADRARGALSLAGDLTPIPAALNAVDAFAHGDVLSGAMGAGETALNVLPELAAVARPALRAGRGLFWGAAREAAEAAPALRAPEPAPLPMDEASRMARAREMGFEGPFYHGTFAPDIRSFDPGSHFGDARAANNRLEDRRLDVFEDDPQPNIMPVRLRSGRSGELWVRDQDRWENPRYWVDESRRESPGRSPQEKAFWQEVRADPDIRRWANRSPYDFEDGFSRDALMARLGEHMSRNGFTRAAYNNTREGGLSYLVPDPSNIRSIFAAFDPAKSGSSDLLAGVPLALGGAALAAQETQKPRGGLFGRSFRSRDTR